MLNLAPSHKVGLPLQHPLLLAAGTVSYGECLPPGVDLSRIGGIVVGPVTAQSQSGRHGPRLVATHSGMILDTGGQNRGVEAATRRFSPLWESLPCAVIVQVADVQSADLRHTLGVLAQAGGIDAIELLIPESASVKAIRAHIETAKTQTDLPLLVHLPLHRAARLAEIVLDCDIETLSLGDAPPGALLRTLVEDSRQPLPVVRGQFYGPANFAPMVHALTAIRPAHPRARLIASGGIHSPAMARQAIALGADAIALDSVVWIDPGAVHAIGDTLDGSAR